MPLTPRPDARNPQAQPPLPDDRPIAPVPENGAPEEHPSRASLGLRVARAVAGVLLSLVATLLGLLVVFFLALQTNPGAGRVGDLLLSVTNPFDSSVAGYEEITGSFITGFELHQLDIIRVDTFVVDTVSTDPLRLSWTPYSRDDSLDVSHVVLDSVHIVHADTFRIGYNLLALLTGTIHVTELHATNLNIHARQAADSTWDVLKVFADTSAADTTRLFDFRLDRLHITEGSLIAEYYPPWRDSTLRVTQFHALVSELEIAEATTVRIDSLSGSYRMPGQPYWADVRARGSLEEGLLRVDDFALQSPHSDVTASGTLVLPAGSDEPIDDVDFTLYAEPLGLRDLHLFLPGLDAERSLRLAVEVEGSSAVLDVRAQADLSDGGLLTVKGTVSPDAEGPVLVDLTGTARQFDPRFFTSGPADAPVVINADFRVDLEGLELETLDGTARADVFDTRIGNTHIVDGLSVTVFEDGLARLEARMQLAEGGLVSAQGSMRPFAEEIVYDLEGRLQNLDAGSFLTGSALATDLSGTFAVKGRGTDPETATLDGRLTLVGSRVNRYDVDRAVATVRLADADLAYNVSMNAPEGFVRARGEVRFGGEQLRYTVEQGLFERFDLAALLGQPQQSNLTGAFELRGSGTDPRQLTVVSELRLADSRYGNLVLEYGDVEAVLRNGRLQTEAEAQFAEAGALQVAVVTRPFDARPLYQIEALAFQNLDLGRLLDNPGLDTDLTGQGSFVLVGLTPPDVTLQGRLTLDQARINEQVIDAATLYADLQGGALDLDANIVLPNGRIAFTAEAHPFATPPTYTASQGQFSNIDLAAFTGNPELRSRLSGTFTLEGRGFDPESAVVDARLALGPSVFNEQRVREATLDVSLQRGDAAFEADVRLPEGGLYLAGVAEPFAPVPTYEIRRGRAERLNVGALLGRPGLQTEITGDLRLRGEGFDLETLDLQGGFELEASQINDQRIDSAYADVRFREGVLHFDAGFDTPDGGARLVGVAEPALETPVYRITEGRFLDLHLGHLLGRPDLDTELTGTLALEGRGTDPDSLDLTATIAFDSSLVNRSELTGGTIEIEMQDGLVDVGASLDFADGHARLTAAGHPFLEVPDYQASGELRRVDLGRLLALDRNAAVSATFAVSGSGLDPETMTLTGQLRAAESEYGTSSLDSLRTAFHLEAGRLRLDTLLLASNAADVRAGGEVALFDSTGRHPSDLRFFADVRTIEPFRPLLPPEISDLSDSVIEGHVYGPPDRLAVDVMAEVGSFIYGDYRVAGFDGHLAAEIGPDREVLAAEVRGDADFLGIPSMSFDEASVDISYGDDLAFDIALRVDEERQVLATGYAELEAEVPAITLETLRLDLGEDDYQLLQEATITLDGAYRVSGLLLYSGDSQIAVDGVIDPNGTQNLVITVEEVRLEPFTDLVGYSGLGGTVTGSVDLTGPAHAPTAEGLLDLEVRSEGRPVGDMRLDLRYEDLSLAIDALLTHEDGSSLTAEGTVPLDLRLSPGDSTAVGQAVQVGTGSASGEVQLTAVADSFAIDWVQPFLDPETIRPIEGRLTGTVEITGTLDNPQLDGSARLVHGVVGLPQFDVRYREIVADLTMQGNTVLIENARLASGDGTLRAEGTVDLAELTLGELSLTLAADDFLAVDNETYRFTIDGDLRLEGTTRQPVLNGDIDVVSGQIRLTDELTSPDLETVELTEEDILALERSFGVRITEEDTTTFDFYNALRMNLEVELARDTWLRSDSRPEMDIQFTGDLAVQKVPNSDAEIYGTIQIVPERSQVVQFGRRFNIASGELTFNGAAANPYIDFEAEYRVQTRRARESEVIIVLDVSGQMQERLDLELSSRDPAGLELTDIVSYIATGRPAGQSLHLGGAPGEGGVLGTAGGIAAHQLAGFVEGVAGSELGLDVIEINQSGFEGTTVTAGKYLTSRLFVSISQPITFGNDPLRATDASGTNRQIITIEYEFFEWLLLRLRRGDTGLLLNFLFEYTY